MADPIVLPGAQEQNYTDMINALKSAGKYAAPNLYSLFSGAPQPQIPNIPQNPTTGEAIPGKVPSTDDPRVPSAILEEANLAANAVPFAIGGGGAAAPLARSAVGGASEFANALRSGASTLPNTLRTGAATAAGLATNPDTVVAQKQPKLTKEQQQQLLLQKQQAEIETAASAAREKAKADAAAEALRQKTLTEGQENDRLRKQRLEDQEKENNRIAAEAEAERKRVADAAQKELDKSWRLKHSEASTPLAAAGWGAAGLLPYAGRSVAAWNANRPIANWEKSIEKAHNAFKAGNIPEAKAFGADALGFKKDYATSLKNAQNEGVVSKILKGTGKVGGATASLLTPFELGMYPEIQDMINGSPKAKENAWNELPDQAPWRALQGLSGYAIGSELPLAVKERLPPNERTNQLVNLLKGARTPKAPVIPPAVAPAAVPTAQVVEPPIKKPRAPRKKP
jgi:hypothetical protein